MITTARRQVVAAVAAGLLGMTAMAVAQSPKTGTEPSKASERKADPERTPVEKWEDLPEVKVQADDSAEVKAAKERLLAAKKKYRLIHVRILGGQFTGATGHTKLGDSLRDLTDAVQELYSDPKDQLPWFEFRLAVAKEMPDSPSVVGERLNEAESEYWKGEQEKAELALAKAQKKLKK